MLLLKAGNKGDVNQWLTCNSSRKAHEAKKLMLTQIIPSDGMNTDFLLGYFSAAF